MEILENSIKLTSEELQEEIYDVIDKKITGQSRWSTFKEGVAKIEGKYYMLFWEEGSTEIQDVELEGGEFSEVVKAKKIIETWVDKTELKE